MNYTAEQLHKKAAELRHSRWIVDECSGCDGGICYRFDGDSVTYDAGCRCEGNNNNQPVKSSWTTVAVEVNSLLLTNKKEDVIKYWKL